MATAPDEKQKKSLSNLGMVWSFAKRYPGHILCAAVALLVAASATSAVPYAFKLIIDRGFAGGGGISRWFEYLLLLVIVMAIATAVRYYFVSWLGERVVADIRLAVHRNLLRLAPGFFEENRPAEFAGADRRLRPRTLIPVCTTLRVLHKRTRDACARSCISLISSPTGTRFSN